MSNVNRLKTCFSEAKQTLLSPYLTAGFPTLDITLPMLHKMVEAGADIIELGIPFSDPMAEGPVIQRAMEQALSQGMTVKGIFQMVADFRQDNQTTPIVLMGYLNTIEITGYETFAKAAAEAGVDGTIIVDLPPEEASEILPIWRQYGLEMIFLCSPTTSDERVKLIDSLEGAYVYYVSLKGVTGASHIDKGLVRKAYERTKSLLSRPLLVGFGIKNAEIAKDMANFADGVVIGAAFLDSISGGSAEEKLLNAYTFLKGIRAALN